MDHSKSNLHFIIFYFKKDNFDKPKMNDEIKYSLNQRLVQRFKYFELKKIVLFFKCIESKASLFNYFNFFFFFTSQRHWQ